MVDTFSKLYRRTPRRPDGHRLARLKALKLRAEIKGLEGKGADSVALMGEGQE